MKQRILLMKVGAIKNIGIRFGGYQDCISQPYIEIKSGKETYRYFEDAGWCHVSEREARESTSNKWTHEERLQLLGKFQWKIIELMKDARVEDTKDLIGKPVRFTTGINDVVANLSILTEVLL